MSLLVWVQQSMKYQEIGITRMDTTERITSPLSRIGILHHLVPTLRFLLMGLIQPVPLVCHQRATKENDNAAYDGTITVETVTSYKTVFDLVDLLLTLHSIQST